ncbi:MAG: nicotinate-nucleotide adenylyltransferase, partial [Flavobacteriales bacterium]|nr:nicotinate-nucleotide adenylyltransferase [Flavobacteriales bacterium]
MKRVGLYFGTFNPIHIGHLIIANYMANHTDLDEVWLVVTPHNPFKDQSALLPDHHRLQMAYLAIKDNMKLQVSDIEFDLPKPNYTINTLESLVEKYPDHKFTLIMGEDNLRSFDRWKRYEDILASFPIKVYPRLPKDGEEPQLDPTGMLKGDIE